MKRFRKNLFLGILIAAAAVTGYIIREKDKESYIIEMGISAEESIPAASVQEDSPEAEAEISTEKPAENSKNNTKININTADINELDALPGIGRVKAERIVKYREKHGNFEVIEDIRKVDGIGRKTFENIKKFISVK